MSQAAWQTLLCQSQAAPRYCEHVDRADRRADIDVVPAREVRAAVELLGKSFVERMICFGNGAPNVPQCETFPARTDFALRTYVKLPKKSKRDLVSCGRTSAAQDKSGAAEDN
jgi:hypothetical protein